MRWLFISILTFSCVNLIAQNVKEELNWYFIYQETGDTIYLGSKGSVQHSFWQKGILPDPFIDSNDRLYSFIEDRIWVLKANFNGDKFLEKQFVDLNLSGIDTYAEVLVNGDIVLNTKNAFVTYQTDISNALVSGMNEVELRITPPTIYHEYTYENEDFHLPSPNDRHSISIASHTRKPQFQFGWDWVTRLNTIGVNGYVTVLGYDDFNIQKPTVFTQMMDGGKGEVRYDFRITGMPKDSLFFQSLLFGELKGIIQKGSFRCFMEKESPLVWSPIGRGQQNLYSDKICVYDSNNQLIKVFNVKFGFKEAQLIQEEDKWGESYFFKVNQQRIFAKGANIIPLNIFISEIDPKDEIKFVEEMVRANFNMVRVWGGGNYASETLLNACDSLGIMVWHDLMFACSMYPGDSSFLNNVKTELSQQLPRLLSHPCIVQINGNNEVAVAWENWGFQKSYELNQFAQQSIQSAYDTLFLGLIPTLLKDYGNFPYTHTSPLSNWGKLSDFNYGSQHYWGLWHGNDELSQSIRKTGRFNSEYGFQSFPSLELLNKFSSSDLLSINDPVLVYKQRSYVGNKKIIDKITPIFGPITHLEDFIYKSQLYQSYVLENYILAHRRNSKRCGGTLFWQLNDVFPGPTWSTIDFSGNYKAAHFKVKNCFEDVLITWVDDSLYISNISANDAQISLSFEWLDFNGRVKESGKRIYHIQPFQTIIEELQPTKKSGVKNNRVLRLSIKINDSIETNSVFSRSIESQIFEGDLTIEKCLLLNEEDGVLEILVNEFSEKTWLLCSKDGVIFEDNFLDLLPGKHLIRFRYENAPEVGHFRIYRK